MRVLSPIHETATIPWWVVLIEGIAILLIGILLITSPGLTTLVIVQFLGFFWLISGILSLASLFMDRTLWGWKLLSGILAILAGLLVVRHPLWSAVLIPTILVLFLAIDALIMGGVKIIHAFQGAGWGTGIIGAIDIAFGIILLMAPVIAALVLPIVVGVFAVAGGIATIILSFRAKDMEDTLNRARLSNPPATSPPSPTF